MRGLLLAWIVLGIASCSWLSGDKYNSPSKLSKLTPNLDIKERWQRDVGKGLGDLYHLVKPAIAAKAVFANDINGSVFAFDRETGKKLWNKRLKIKVSSGVGLGNNLVLIGSLDGDVIALSQKNGEEVWRVNIASEILAPPQANEQGAVVQTNDGKLYGLDVNDGKVIWNYTAKLPILTLRGTATPQLFGANLVTGFANGKIAALSAVDGTLFWERRIAYPQGRTEIERVVDIDGSPVVSGKLVYSTSYNGHLMAISPNGQTQWKQKISSHQSPLVVDGRVFVTESTGVLHAFDANTGLPLWQNDLLLYRKLAAPQVLAGFVAVSDYKGYIHVFDPELGVVIARGRFDKDGIRSPMVSDGTYLYALGNDGELSSISVHLRGSRSEIKAIKKNEKEAENVELLKTLHNDG